MINLKDKGLPNAIEVDGKPYLIKTDFRYWLDFENAFDEYNKTYDFDYFEKFFVVDIPDWEEEAVKQLSIFYACPEATPKSSVNTDGTEIVNLILDGSYIYASFMQAYGIDLIDCDMHWYKFMALFRGLPEDTKIQQIMSYRSYKKSNKSYEKMQEEARNAWELPRTQTQEEIELNDEINELFYNA